MIEKTSTLLVIIVGLFLRSKTFALSSNESLGDECKDLHEKCMRWAESGECEKNESYMLIHCLESCNVCKSASSYGTKQMLIKSGKLDEFNINVVLARTHKYMTELKQKYPVEWISECVNRDELCALRASQKKCEKESALMAQYCAPACGQCEEFFRHHMFQNKVVPPKAEELRDNSDICASLPEQSNVGFIVTNARTKAVEYIKHELDDTGKYLLYVVK